MLLATFEKVSAKLGPSSPSYLQHPPGTRAWRIPGNRDGAAGLGMFWAAPQILGLFPHFKHSLLRHLGSAPSSFLQEVSSFAMCVTSHSYLVLGCREKPEFLQNGLVGSKEGAVTATGWVGALAQQPRGAHQCSLSPLQHSDGTFCVKPLKQKQVVSVGVSSRWWQPP